MTLPISLNFSDIVEGPPKIAAASRLNSTALLYTDVLYDVDSLLNTGTAFQLGPWLAKARSLAGNATD